MTAEQERVDTILFHTIGRSFAGDLSEGVKRMAALLETARRERASLEADLAEARAGLAKSDRDLDTLAREHLAAEAVLMLQLRDVRHELEHVAAERDQAIRERDGAVGELKIRRMELGAARDRAAERGAEVVRLRKQRDKALIELSDWELGHVGLEVAETIRRIFAEPSTPDAEAEETLLALTMTPEAAEHFKAALLHAAARIPQAKAKTVDEPMDHADWLRWGANRLDAVITAPSRQPILSNFTAEEGGDA